MRSLHFLKKIVIENYVFAPLKKSQKKMRLQDAFHHEDNKIVAFKIPKRFAFFTYLI